MHPTTFNYYDRRHPNITFQKMQKTIVYYFRYNCPPVYTAFLKSFADRPQQLTQEDAMRALKVFIKVTVGQKVHQECRFCILLDVDQHISSSLVPEHKHTVGTTNNHGNTHLLTEAHVKIQRVAQRNSDMIQTDRPIYLIILKNIEILKS